MFHIHLWLKVSSTSDHGEHPWRMCGQGCASVATPNSDVTGSSSAHVRHCSEMRNEAQGLLSGCVQHLCSLQQRLLWFLWNKIFEGPSCNPGCLYGIKVGINLGASWTHLTFRLVGSLELHFSGCYEPGCSSPGPRGWESDALIFKSSLKLQRASSVSAKWEVNHDASLKAHEEEKIPSFLHYRGFKLFPTVINLYWTLIISTTLAETFNWNWIHHMASKYKQDKSRRHLLLNWPPLSNSNGQSH